jgi:hypothetical protein
VKTGMADDDWDVLLSRIRDKRCTPFLGAGASAHILPTGKELAAEWADKYGFPLADRDDLAQVAQYMAIRWDIPFPKDRVSELCKEIHPAKALKDGDSYDIISSLNLPMYITTNYDDLLMFALKNRHKDPQALLCPWHKSVQEQEQEERTYNYVPTPEKPAVYYLHGSAHEPGSIVITEDDYLDFIVWVTELWGKQADVSLVSPAVKNALARNSLLFIGYSQNDWSFRVLMRCIKQSGANLGSRHVAVQLSPLGDDATEDDQKKIEEYLTRYFSVIHGHNPITLYWGKADAFLKDLQERLPKPKES